MTTPPLDLPALRDIANAATDGPWRAKGDDMHAWEVWAKRTKAGTPHVAQALEADARHIAAFDPPTVLALIARAEAAEAVIRHVRAARDEFDKNGSLAFLQMELDRALDATP